MIGQFTFVKRCSYTGKNKRGLPTRLCVLVEVSEVARQVGMDCWVSEMKSRIPPWEHLDSISHTGVSWSHTGRRGMGTPLSPLDYLR